MENYLQNNLIAYYLIPIIIGILMFLLNSDKKNRYCQTNVPIFFMVYILVSTSILICFYALSGVASFDSKLLKFIYIVLYIFKHLYSYATLAIIIAGIIIKFRINEFLTQYGDVIITDEDEEENDASDDAKKIEKKKRKLATNFLVKWFYDSNFKLNEKGILISKIALIMSISFMLEYAGLPILLECNVDLFLSKSEVLLLFITFIELYYSLTAYEKLSYENQMESMKSNSNLMQLLKKSLKLHVEEVLNGNERMIGKTDVVLNSPSALICEVPNAREFKEINIKIMNTTFFENKKVLVVCENEKKSQQYHNILNKLNKEYDGKLAIKLLTPNDKLFDESVDIYVTAIENCFGNMRLLSEINTIIFDDYDQILFNKLELIRAFGSIVKMGNPKIDYVVLTYMLQGIEATIKNLLFVNDVSYYCTQKRQQPDKLILNVWNKNDRYISSRIFGKEMNNISSMVAISMLSVKWTSNRILLISDNEPLQFELNELNSIRNLSEREISNSDIKFLSENFEISNSGKYYEYSPNNWIITDDKENLYEKIYKFSLINGKENNLNIVSDQYLLRDYMIDTYSGNKTRLKSFLPYVPCEVNSGKVVLYNLLLQLTNFGVKENIISNIFNENGIEVKLGHGSNLRLIADKLNLFIKQEFNIDVDVYSYITLQELNDKYVFDVTKKKFIEEERIYLLDERALRLFPNEIFSRVRFVKDGFALDIEKEYAYNFYQKYLPGQKHFINGYVYEIKNIVETDDGIDAILEASTNYDNRMYRQDRKVKLTSEFEANETKKNRYNKIVSSYQIGKIDYEIKTEGYYEFKNGISLTPRNYRYVELDNTNVLRTFRKHQKSDTLKIEIKNFEGAQIRKTDNGEITCNEKIGQRLAFLLTEVLTSFLGENANYVQVKAVMHQDTSNIITWVSPINDAKKDPTSIEILIFEDTKIERGLIDLIYKNIDNLLKTVYEYLKWVFNSNAKDAHSDHKEFLKNADEEGIIDEEYKNLMTILGEMMM